MSTEINGELVFSRLPIRPAGSNKGTFGHALLVAGSSRYRGAAALAAEGALRAGAGLVTLASVEEVYPSLLARLPECCLLPLPRNESGSISAAALPLLRQALEHTTALLFGPGLTGSEDTAALAAGLLTDCPCPAVVDADGLNVLNRTEGLARANGVRIVTPHPGEMARLTHLSVEDIQGNRAGIASSYARTNHCYVVLKGHRTVIASPDGELLVNPTGGPGLAKGGSGDILAGMITAFLAQGLSPLDACICGVWLHGAAADETAKRLGQYGMLPHDLFYDLERLFAQNGR